MELRKILSKETQYLPRSRMSLGLFPQQEMSHNTGNFNPFLRSIPLPFTKALSTYQPSKNKHANDFFAKTLRIGAISTIAMTGLVLPRLKQDESQKISNQSFNNSYCLESEDLSQPALASSKNKYPQQFTSDNATLTYLKEFLPDIQPGKITQLPSFTECLIKNDLAQVPVKSVNEFEKDSNLIPNFMHYIYIVNPLKDRNCLTLIQQFKKLNPEYITTLWIDKSAYDKDELKDLIGFAQNNAVHLLDAQDIFHGHMGKLELFYRLECFRNSPGAASDILRLFILLYLEVFIAMSMFLM